MCVIYQLIFCFLKLAPTFLVVHETAVIGNYLDLKKAKEILNKVEKGQRLIAEVDGLGNLSRDSRIIGGQTQGTDEGFNSIWEDQKGIDMLMDTCQKYLDFTGKLKTL